jgi:hypothetical protein
MKSIESKHTSVATPARNIQVQTAIRAGSGGEGNYDPTAGQSSPQKKKPR